MNIALIIVAGFLGVVTTSSAIGKLRRMPQMMEMLRHGGLNDGQIRLLTFIEFAGALGLLLGIWVSILGMLAAAGFVIYFVGALPAHLRVNETLKEFAPAVSLAGISLVT